MNARELAEMISDDLAGRTYFESSQFHVDLVKLVARVITEAEGAARADEREQCLFAAAVAENNGGSACAAIRARCVK